MNLKYIYACFLLFSFTQLAYAQNAELTPQVGDFGLGKVIYSPDGKYFSSIDIGGSIKLWDANSAKLIRTFYGHRDEVSDVNFSKDGTQLVSVSEDKTIKTWNVKTGAIINDFDTDKEKINSVCFSPDMEFIVYGGGFFENKITIWNIHKKKEEQTINTQNYEIEVIKFSPDGRRLAIVMDKSVEFLDWATKKRVFFYNLHRREITDIDFSPDSKLLASSSNDGTFKVTNIETGESLPHLNKEGDRRLGIAFNRNGTQLAVCDNDNKILVYEVETGNLLNNFRGVSHASSSFFENTVFYVDFSPVADILISGSGSGDIAFWDLNYGGTIQEINAQFTLPMYLNYSKSNQILFFSEFGSIERVKVWDLKFGKPTNILEGIKNQLFVVEMPLIVSKDGHSLASFDEEYINIINIHTGKITHQLPISNGNEFAMDELKCDFSHNSERFVLKTPREIIVWEIATEQRIVEIKLNFNYYGGDIRFSSDNENIVVGVFDGFKIWNITTKKEIRNIKTDYSDDLETSSGAKEYLSISDNETYAEVGIWDEKFTLMDSFTLKSFNASNSLLDVFYSADDQYIIAYGEETVEIWDKNTLSWKNTISLKGNISAEVLVCSIQKDIIAVVEKQYEIDFWNTSTGKKVMSLTAWQKNGALQPYVVRTPDGKYDGNEIGLSKLHYVKGMEVLPLPLNDPNRIPDLMRKVLNKEPITPTPINPTISRPIINLFELPSKTPKPNIEIGGFINLVNTKSDIQILVNNKPIASFSFKNSQINAKVTLKEGENSILIKANNQSGYTQTIINIEYEPPTYFRKGKDFALLFAVDDYDGKEWKRLKNPLRDADTIACMLAEKYGFDTVVVRNPTHSEIMSKLNEYTLKAFENDAQLLIYFTGHGQVSASLAYFIAKNSKAGEAFKDNQVSYSNIKTLIKKIECQHILLVVDACYSAFDDAKIPLDKKKPDGKHPKKKDAFKKWVDAELSNRSHLFIGSGVDKTSDGIDHSPMTLAIIDAFTRNDVMTFGVLESNLKLMNATYVPVFRQLSKHKDGTFLFISKEKQK